MTEIRKRAFVGIVGLVSAGVFSVGCSSSGNTTGTGGSSGSAGSSGTAGTSGGTAGTTGSGGSTGAGGTTVVTCTAPSSANIDSFSGADGSANGVGAVYAYAPASLTKPTTTTATGPLVVTVATGAETVSTDNYVGFGLPFNACTDASAHTGVKFNIMGTLSAGCTIQFSTVDREHQTIGSSALGACTSGCYPSSDLFTLPTTATDVTVAFTAQTGGVASPTTAPVVDPSEVLDVQWQINVPTAGCTGTITVNNITFQ